MRRPLRLLAAVLATAAVVPSMAARRGPDKKSAEASKFKAETFTGLAFRGIGPAFNSGRIVDVVVHPNDRGTWYVAAASGGVWKTTNAGTTWTPVFDDQGSYSIGCLALDPKDPLVLWVGTGENNSQRSVGYGDGVYKSLDGGKSWEKKGLKDAEHIGKILLDPRDGRVAYVAAQGPLWAAGGDRGLYKTTDGGVTWKQVLSISEHTGVSDVVFDPRNPDVLYAVAYQRRRHVWTLIDGGPESAIYKSSDAGGTWRKLTAGLPKEDMGRIGISVSPVDADVVYAVVEAAGKAGGFFRSTDAGGSWEKRGDYVSASPQYYQEIYADPRQVDRVYSMDTWMMVTDDGGRTFRKVGERYKHVDNHAFWFDPEDPDHFLAGCDGGLYETWDRAATWEFKANLPITQFYRVAVDDTQPFYNVYGGTQDNQTLGGPSRTRTVHGITNQDWFVTLGGDGFEPAVDPTDPNILYAQYQHGGLVRFDRRTGERLDIQPQPDAGDEPLRWNWDSPLLISPHAHTRLYFGAQRLFRSDDRGASWRPVSPDLTRRVDRNRLPVMDRIWGVDAVAKNASTSFYGNLVSLTESPVAEGLLYAGTDDGLVQVTEDGGATWRAVESFPGVPDRSYVADLEASRHDATRVYAAFDNHKMGDFKPYVLRSSDKGRTWVSIAGDLPIRGTVYTLAEDPVQRDLLFAGTEFGVFFTLDGGARWIQLKGGMPVIAVRDLAIQERASDLVLASFGRGFFILDDYSPLRRASAAFLEQAAALLPVRPAWTYVPSDPLGGREKASLGDAFFTAPNPPFGAVFTYYLGEEIKTLRQIRHEREKKIAEEKGAILYPTWDELRAEDREEPPAILLTVRDEDGRVVRRIQGPVTAGFHRVAWDLRYPPSVPASLVPPEPDPWADFPAGPLAAPGIFRVEMTKRADGVLTPIGEPQSFQVATLGSASMPSRERAEALAFEKKAARLQRAVLGAVECAAQTQKTLDLVKKALDDTLTPDAALAEEARSLIRRLEAIKTLLSGDSTLARRNEPTLPSIADRAQRVVDGQVFSSEPPTATQRRDYELAAQAFAGVLAQLQSLVEVDLEALHGRLEAAGAPWTPGRVPRWTPE
jgi:photosystem II stability/assembly factor-like uncharacterized protein